MQRRRKLRRLARSWPRERTKPSAPEKRRLTAVPNDGGAASSAAFFLELWALVAFKCPIVLTYCDGNFEGAPQLRGSERQARVPRSTPALTGPHPDCLLRRRGLRLPS